jgi:hypothetical protein
MMLPNNFQFSHAALQDFVDCPRRFYLRYVRQLRYPAPESDPLRDLDQHVQREARFRKLVQQHQIGIPVKALAATIADDTLAEWWDAYLAHPPADLPPTRRAEVTLSVPLAGRRLIAKFDLLAVGERAVIVVWKTAPHRPTRAWLEKRLQTVVYPYVLAQAGAHLNGGKPIPPDAIRLIYWFVDEPQQPEVFEYSAAQYKRDDKRLATLAADMLKRESEADFELTEDVERCLYCAYRSLNDRGTKAGNLLLADADKPAELFDLDLRLDQIGELGF